MPKFQDLQVIPYPQDIVYSVAKDVGAYPEFLPWCTGARVFSEKKVEPGKGVFDADLVIGFGMFREQFTSRVQYEDQSTVRADYIKGPMKYCVNRWQFEEASEGQTRVDFYVDFEFANRLMQTAMEEMFMAATQKMIRAFRDRAAVIATGRKPKSKNRVSNSSPFLQMLDARRRG